MTMFDDVGRAVKLEFLAEWFDVQDRQRGDHHDHEVQDDLRAIARRLREVGRQEESMMTGPDETEDVQAQAAGVVDAFAAVTEAFDSLRVITESLSGMRREMVAQGWSPEAAEEIILGLWRQGRGS